MEGQRQQYIPAPPPPSHPQAGPQGHLMNIPPPPPRPTQNTAHNVVIPPPPPHPSTAYGVQPGWQRQPAMAHPYPPPPPPIPGSNQPQYQHLAYGTQNNRQPAPLSIPPPPSEPPPLTSATYIPERGTFGPGVGIPALFNDGNGYSQHPEDHNHMRKQSYVDGFSQQIQPDNSHPGTTAFRDSHESIPSGHPTPMWQNSHGQPPAQAPGHAALDNAHTHRLAPGGTSQNNASSHETCDRWPLDHVLLWLAQNEFSNEWQETFKALDMKGADFIELGRRGKMGKFHQIVYPQLAKECTKSGTLYKQAHEREEGKRLLKLVRAIAESQDWESTAVLPSASTDGGLENSPNLAREILATHPNSAAGEHSPGQKFSYPTNASPGHRQFSAPLATSTATYEPSSNENGNVDPNSRSELTRNILNLVGERRRHSPSASSDTGYRPDNKSHSRSPVPQYAAAAPADSTQSGDGMYNKRYSSDSTMMSRGASAQGTYGIQGSALRSTTSASPGDLSTGNRYYDSKRFNAGPSPQEQAFRHGTGESCPKEHGKGLFHLFRKKKGQDSSHQSPEEANPESPTSPGGGRSAASFPSSGKPGLNGSDMSIAEQPSSISDHDRPQSHTRKSVLGPPAKRRYLLATPDGWNYRLVDVTDVDAADTLRAVICSSVGLQDPGSAQIYLTEPGQMSHEEPLSDTMLVVNRRSKSDSHGTLKLFVYSIPSSINGTQSAGLGLTIQEDSLYGNRQNDGIEGGDGNGMKQMTHAPRAPSPATRQSRLYFPYVPGWPTDNSLEDAAPPDGQDGDTPLLASQGEHQRAVGRQRRSHLQPKQEQIQRKEIPRNSPYGIRRDGVIDFDSPRISPFDEKKNDSLVPLRKPPSAPAESNTLTKVNSLSKRPGMPSPEVHTEHQRRKSKDSTSADRHRPHLLQTKATSPNAGNLGAALASVGRMSGAIGEPSPSHDGRSNSSATSTNPMSGKSDSTAPSAHSTPRRYNNSAYPRLPSIQANDESFFTTSDYEGLSLPTDKAHQNESKADVVKPQSPPQSAVAKDTPESQSQKSHGPHFDFQETEVSFAASPLPQDDSEEDSDEGLFAKPLANKPNVRQTKRKPTPQAKQGKQPPSRPSLKVETTEGAMNTRTVKFKSSPSTAGEPSTGLSTQSASTEQSDARSAISQVDGGPNDSSANPGHTRRESLVRDDIWASRPPVEGMIEHLDDYFPNIDLDEPYLEGFQQSPPVSPTSTPIRDEAVPEVPSLRDRAAQKTDPPGNLMCHDSSDPLGSNESTLTPKNKGGSGLSRSTQPSTNRSGGGLNRMKSIREVARGAQQVRRKQSAVSTNTKSEVPLRRKSTKMFGARIMQISPQPGSRLSDLDPLPQHHPAVQGKIPQRQPTFRIIRGQLIGKGTYGKVYLGINADNGEILAVKHVEVSPKTTGNDTDRMKEVVAAIDQEIDTMQHLEHPNIVQYLGCERAELAISIYLEYIPGGSVGSCLRKHGKFEESVVKSLNRQVLSGLAYLHDQGILHRDLKADNILLDLDGTCKISDFGISKKTDNIYGNDVTNSMQGSVFWMAPEVVQSQGQGYSAKVDIWSLGCVVLEMFAGRRPWSTEEAIGAIFKLGSLNQAPPIPEDVSLNISPAALAFMYDCFTIGPFDRPTAETLLSKHPFCIPDSTFQFLNTELHAKIRHVL